MSSLTISVCPFLEASINAKADINIQNNDNHTALLYALKKDIQKLLNYLLVIKNTDIQYS